jgi:small GTP-binding protein
MSCHLLHMTAHNPGAIAILQLHGEYQSIVRELTGLRDWPLHRMRLANLADIDHGLVVALNDSVAQIMPHGGPRVVQRLTAKLVELGAEIVAADAIDPQAIYPEAADRFEALMLLALARAESPLAVDLLLDQPRRWREFTANASGETLTGADRARSLRLNRLLDAPIVVLAGAPNVGKSTLSNALLGRSMSIALDMPGTTRDYTAGRIDLSGLVVDWHDTPGMRETSDPIERRSMEIARRLIDRADLLIAMRDPDSPWPHLPREADLRVMNKCDLVKKQDKTDALLVSAQTGENMPALVNAVRDALVSNADLADAHPWLFDARIVQKP